MSWGWMRTRAARGGRTFTPVSADRPQSLAATDDTLFLLDDGALLASADGEHFVRIARAHTALRFQPSTLVSAPLVVHDGALWSASPRTGEVFVAGSE